MLPLPDYYFIENHELYWAWRHAFQKELNSLLHHLDYGLTKQKELKKITEGLEQFTQSTEKYRSVNEIQLACLGFCSSHYILEHFDREYLKWVKLHYQNLLAWKDEIFHPLKVDIEKERMRYIWGV